LNVFRAFTINKNTNSDVKMELHIHKVRKTNLTWCRSQRSLCVDEERGSLHFGGSIEHNGLRQLFLPADSCQKAVGRLRCKTSSISWWIQCSDVAHGNAICTYWKWRIPTHFFACVLTTVYHTKILLISTEIECKEENDSASVMSIKSIYIIFPSIFKQR